MGGGGGNFARFATGIAGTPDDSFLITTCYWNGLEWEEVSINNHKATGFLSREQCLDIFEANNATKANFDDNPDRFLNKANKINKTMHDNAIAVGDRAKVLGALLLALAAEGAMRIHQDPTQMVNEINGRINHILREHGKDEFGATISLTLPATSKNHKTFRKAVVEILQHLRLMNVRSAVNSGDDALGKFYETFLKYANGAKEMGIVLTPRHVTKFAVESLGVTWRDKVYDPACGTGGFLVAAMDHVRKSKCSESEFCKFKSDGLWGVEKEDPVYGLALVNMIFRGDGKSGLHDGSCFDHEFWKRDGLITYCQPEEQKPEGAKRSFSRVFMNPPFKINQNAETDFVDHALNQCKEGALLFAVLPHLNIGGQRDANWRKELLNRHTVKAIIKMDKSLFYPVQEVTYGLVIESHRPHDLQNKVMMAYLFDDNSRPRISKVQSSFDARDNVKKMTERLKLFLLGMPIDIEEIPKEMTLTTLKPDEGCSYSPEAYIPNAIPVTLPDVTDRALALRMAVTKAAPPSKYYPRPVSDMKAFPLMDFIERQVTAPLKAVKSY